MGQEWPVARIKALCRTDDPEVPGKDLPDDEEGALLTRHDK
jgi:hypothetical protein